MESVDKLRELPVFGAVSVDGDLNATNQRMVCATKEEVLEIADEIEAEIAEQYQLLPVDADGVPIRVGDIMERVDGGPSQQACCICPGGFNDAPIWCARDFCHVKQRTLEDVLEELEGLRGYGNSTYEDVVTRAAELADEIRELLGGDAE